MRKSKNAKNADAESYIDIMEKNHMEIPWHDYASADSNVLICKAGLIEKASVIGRVGSYHALMRNRCMACPYFHEQAFQRTGCSHVPSMSDSCP